MKSFFFLTAVFNQIVFASESFWLVVVHWSIEDILYIDCVFLCFQYLKKNIFYFFFFCFPFFL